MTGERQQENKPTSATGERGAGRALKPRPLRRLGAVVAVDDERLRVWINGVTSEEGEWVDKRHLPATLHDDGSTFDVWLYDDEPIKNGAYTPQVNPTTNEPWTDEEPCIVGDHLTFAGPHGAYCGKCGAKPRQTNRDSDSDGSGRPV